MFLAIGLGEDEAGQQERELRMRQNITMGRIVIAGAFALGLCAPASAADPTAEVIIPAAPAPYNWTGFYAGVHGGYGWGDADAVDPGVPDQEPEGGFGGLQVGYDHQFSNNVLLGIVADLSFGKIDDSAMAGNFLTNTGEVDYFGTVRGRVGYAVDRFLPYATGGLAWAHSEASISCPTGAGFGVCSIPQFAGQSRSDDVTSTGWVLGVGLDYAFAENWSANVEYLYADFGKETYDLDIFGEGEVDSTLNMLKLGVNYRF
jgi:outer membrane immunogenic protein